MAHENNKLTKFNAEKYGIIQDNKVTEEVLKPGEKGIKPGDIAYARVINTMVTQASHVVFTLAEVLAKYLNEDAPSIGITDGVTEVTQFENALKNLSNAVLDTNWKLVKRDANKFYAGPVSGVSTSGSFRILDALDIPSLDTSKITTGKFTGERIADSTIETKHLSDGVVKNNKIDANTIANNKLLDKTITNEKIANKTITNGLLADKTITNEKIADSAIQNRNIENNSINGLKLTDATVSNDKLINKTITDSKISDTANIALSKLAAGNLRSVKNGIATTMTANVVTEVQMPVEPDANTIYFII